MPRRFLLPLLLLLSIGAPAAHAWNAAGHRLSAAIAWREMDEPTRAAVTRLLERHPDHAVWLRRSSKLAPDYAAFLEASTWADDIKRDQRFHDSDEAPTPALKGFPDMDRHRDWHHVDHPFGEAPRHRHTGKGQLDRQLEQLQRTIGDRRQPLQARAYALPWLLHLVADAHQPLHAVSRYDSEGQGDEGGNALTIDNPFHPRRNSMSLHAYWDDLPGPPWLRGEHLEQAADRLLAGRRAPATPGEPEQWLNESIRLARDIAYADLAGEVPTLSAAYHERAQRTARERVALAGHRLALLLRQLFGAH